MSWSTARATSVVDVPRSVVSATLTEQTVLGLDAGLIAPGDEVSLLRGRFRITAVTLDGLRAELVRGPFRAFSLRVRLTETPGGVLVAGEARWRTPFPSLTDLPVRATVLDLLSSVAGRIRDRATVLADATVVVGAAIVRGSTLLAQQRAYPPAAAGLWELPGGRVERGETDVAAVRRECREELGVDVVVGHRLGPDVALRNGWLLRTHQATIDDTAVPHPHDHADLRWLTAGQLGSVPWLPADRVLLPTLRAALRTTG